MADPQMIQFHIASGRAWEGGPGIGVYHHPRAGYWLYTVAEAIPPSGETACRRAIAAVEGVLRGWSLSYTSGLRAGLLQVHQEQQASRSRECLGMTCALLRNGQIYLAQAGPTLAYIWSHGRLRRLAPADAQPLGVDGEPQVQLRRHHVAAGDVILVASTCLPRLIPQVGVEALLSSSMEVAARGLYRLARQEASFSALLLRPAYLE